MLALQGDFREHLETLEFMGENCCLVKDINSLNQIDALIIPGGESTTLSKLSKAFDLFEPIRNRIQSGLPTYGSCAGMIMLADEILEPASGQESFGGIPMLVRRNAFGSQVESFEQDLDIAGLTYFGNDKSASTKYRGVFIRAPWVEKVAPEVEIMASVEKTGVSHPVMVRYKNLLATSFHPEITADSRIHGFFVDELVKKARV